MLVLIIVAIMAGNAAGVVDLVRGTKLQRARADLKLIAEGIWGGRPYESGFVGDIGRLPANLTGELTFATGFAPVAVAASAQHGWQGPYAGYDEARLAKDPWDQPWRMLADGRIASSGPDATAETDDDLVAPSYPPAPNGVASTVGISVLDERGQALDGASVSVRVSTSAGTGVVVPGTLQWVSALDTGGGRFVATDLSPGRHAVEVEGITGGALEGSRGVAMAWTAPGGCGSAEVRIRF
jgi:hypothetical protein